VALKSSAAPAPSPRKIREDLRLSRERMGRLVDVSAKTIERWEARDALPASPALRSRLSKIQEIVRVGRAVFTREGFLEFLSTPVAAEGGYTPLQLIELGQPERVIAALAADYEGLGY